MPHSVAFSSFAASSWVNDTTISVRSLSYHPLLLRVGWKLLPAFISFLSIFKPLCVCVCLPTCYFSSHISQRSNMSISFFPQRFSSCLFTLDATSPLWNCWSIWLGFSVNRECLICNHGSVAEVCSLEEYIT